MRIANNAKLKADYVELINYTLDRIPDELRELSNQKLCIEALSYLNEHNDGWNFSDYPAWLNEYLKSLHDLCLHWDSYTTSENKALWIELVFERIHKKTDELIHAEPSQIIKYLDDRKKRKEQSETQKKIISQKNPPKPGDISHVDPRMEVSADVGLRVTLSILISTGVDAIQEHNYTLAIDLFSQAILLNPNDPQFYIFRALSFINMEKYPESIEDLTRALGSEELDGTHKELLYMQRGDNYHQLEKYAEAISDYTSAIECNPINPDGYMHRSTAYFSTGDYTSAMSDLNKLIELDSNCANAILTRARIHAIQKDFQPALIDYTRVLELNEDAEAFGERGEIYLKQQQYARAIQDFEQTCRLEPNNIFNKTRLEIARKELRKHTSWTSYFFKSIPLSEPRNDHETTSSFFSLCQIF